MLEQSAYSGVVLITHVFFTPKRHTLMRIVFKIALIVLRGVIFATIYCLSAILFEIASLFQLIKLILHPSKNQFDQPKGPFKAKNV